MAKQVIGIGAAANDGTGDPLRTAFDKCNSNFTELYADGWTRVVLASDFPTTGTGNTSVTGLNFTPAANLRYEIEGRFIVQSSVTTTGIRPGIAWPGGYTHGVAEFSTPNSATATILALLSAATGTANAAGTGVAVITRSYLARMHGVLIMGASPTGTFQITLASEITATEVKMMAGSFFRYRAY